MSQYIAEIPSGKLTRAEYMAWCEQQPRGRFERQDGRVVAMSAELSSHALVKRNACAALLAAVRAGRLRCEVFPDGMTIAIDADTDYEPDAVVQCGDLVAHDSQFLPNPMIVVEVESPSTASIDTGIKLTGYFRVPSLMHYVIVRTRKRVAVHHRRDGTGISTSIVADGALRFDPPGITVDLSAFYEDTDIDNA